MRSPVAERKLIHWAVGYLAVAWILLEASGEVSAILGWPDWVQRAVFILLLFGLPAVVVVAWFHGEKGRQRVTRLEIGILAGLAVVASVSAYAFASAPPVRAGPSPAPGPTLPLGAFDTTRHVALPFRYTGDIDTDLAEEIVLHDALARWRGITLVEPLRVPAAMATARAHRHPSQDGADAIDRDVALSLGAGRYLTGAVVRLGTAIRLHVALHDVRAAEPLADTVILIRDAAALEPALADAAHALLFRAAGVAPGPAPTHGTRSFPAAVAYRQGVEAMERWALADAETRFAEAARIDPDYAAAHLWRAQVRVWADTRADEVLAFAERAAAAPAGALTDRERLLAAALLAMGRGQYPEACEAYESLRRLDDRDFAAWFGLAECRATDPVVVADSTSPSGWAFRGSYHRALLAYERAFELLPVTFRGFGTPTHELAARRLFITTRELRTGWRPPTDSMFHGLPSFQADTIAFVPYPARDFYAGVAGARDPTHWAAVQRQQAMFTRAAELWASAFPQSVEALEAKKHALESSGDPQALAVARELRALARDPVRIRRQALDEVLLSVRFAVPDNVAELQRALLLADSLVGTGAPSGGGEARRAAAVAALTGRADRAAQLAALSVPVGGLGVTIPAQVAALSHALLTYAAIGAPADSIAAFEDRLDAAIRNAVPPSDQDRVRSRLLDRAAVLAFSTRPLRRTQALARRSDYRLLRAIAAFSRDDLATAASTLDSIWGARGQLRPSDLPIDAVFAEAWLAAGLGNPSDAAAALDSTLLSLRWNEPDVLDLVGAATLGRAMALRAELAHASGDRVAAARWARALVTLWSNADDSLQPVVRRMRALISEPGPGADLTPHPEGGRSPW